MKTREIIKQLEKLGDVDVKYVYDYGDRWRIVYLCDFGEAFDDVFDEAHMRG
jgi:hypothetical protein